MTPREVATMTIPLALTFVTRSLSLPHHISVSAQEVFPGARAVQTTVSRQVNVQCAIGENELYVL